MAALAGRWGDTTVTLPGRWTGVLTGEQAGGGERSVAELLRRFPVAAAGRDG